MAKVFGRWSEYQDVINGFRKTRYDDNFTPSLEELVGEVPSPGELLFASYGGGSYEGDAVVLFEKNGTLYEVRGSHCSCYGLEDQWNPSPVTWDALALRIPEMKDSWGFLGDHEPEAGTAFRDLVASKVTGQATLDDYNAAT